MVISKGLFHPSVSGRKLLIHHIKEYGFETVSRKNIDSAIMDYACAILFFHEKEMKAGEASLLADYLESGGNIIAVHGALASFKSNSDYQNLLGGKFIGHARISTIEITESASSEPFCQNCSGSDIKDELYLFDMSEDSEIILTGKTSGVSSPVLWKHVSGAGTVFCFSLGHRIGTLKLGIFNQILKNILERIYEEY